MQYYRDGLVRQSRLSRRTFVAGGLAGAFAMNFRAGHAASPEGPSSFLARIAAVPDGRTLRTSDGADIILPHILPPGPDRHEPMEDLTPVRLAARALADLALGREVRVDLAVPGQDRHGRWRGSVVVDGRDVAVETVLMGMARVFPEPGATPAEVAPLLAAERAARDGAAGFWGPGFWGDGYFAVHDAAAYGGGMDRFEIVAGAARRQSRIGDRLHLEFGDDWRDDFTAGLSRRAQRAVEVEDFEGRALTLRGWVRHWNGPFMEIEEAVQIEGL